MTASGEIQEAVKSCSKVKPNPCLFFQIIGLFKTGVESRILIESISVSHGGFPSNRKTPEHYGSLPVLHINQSHVGWPGVHKVERRHHPVPDQVEAVQVILFRGKTCIWKMKILLNSFIPCILFSSFLSFFLYWCLYIEISRFLFIYISICRSR